MQFDWEQAAFEASEVARMIGVPAKVIANWTDRGLVDPYRGSWEWKRGRGRARQYSLHDVLTFAAMKDLSDRYEIPVSLGRRICAVAFESFTPSRAGFLVVDRVRADRVKIEFFPTAEALLGRLGSVPMRSALILDTKTLCAAVQGEAERLAQSNRRSSRPGSGERSPESIAP